MELNALLQFCMFFGQKSGCTRLTEYEMLSYEQASNTVAAFCKLQTLKINEEINQKENENFTPTEEEA